MTIRKWTWGDVVIAGIGGFGVILALGLLVLSCTILSGCRVNPVRPTLNSSSVGPPILPVAEGDVEYLEEDGRASRLLIRQDSVAVLVTTVHGNRCPVAGSSGELLNVSRAFVGTSGQPSVGDTLGGAVVQSTVIDTLTVTAGRFLLTCVAPDTLEGFAWLRLASLAPCRQDSLVRPLRLIRTHPP